MNDVFVLSLRALRCCGAEKKINLIRSLKDWVDNNEFHTDSKISIEKIPEPGRPTLPIHVHPTDVRRRRLGTPAGRVSLIHAVAHIEFNAMNLALDAVYRFRKMPHEYYRDWMRVASEESIHFNLLVKRLDELGTFYGALPAHGGMWTMAVETDY